MTHHVLRKHQNDLKSTSTTPPLHRDSRVISKVQPKIRIIHIFAPEIIQTDVANFRELVQRLTGKPSHSSTTTAAATTTTMSTSLGSSLEKNTSANSDANKARNKLAMRPQLMEPIYNNNNTGDLDESPNYHYKPVINVNNKDRFGGYDDHRDSGGFLEVFDGVNDYFMEMGDFSLAPNDNLQTHHQHLDHHMYNEDTFHPLSYRG